MQLIDSDGNLSRACHAAVDEVFFRFDEDMDGLLNDRELEAFLTELQEPVVVCSHNVVVLLTTRSASTILSVGLVAKLLKMALRISSRCMKMRSLPLTSGKKKFLMPLLVLSQVNQLH